MGITTSDYVDIGSTITLAGTAFLAPYLVERWKHSFRSPKLSIQFKHEAPLCHMTQMVGSDVSFPVYYFRFEIKNLGKTQAEDCEVFLEEIHKENSAGDMIQLKDFTPLNLKWSGIGEELSRTIQPGKVAICDIGRIHHPSHKYTSRFRKMKDRDQKKHKFIFELPVIYFSQPDSLLPGKYKIHIAVYSKNAKKITRYFDINWSGNWKDDEIEMFNELVIK